MAVRRWKASRYDIKAAFVIYSDGTLIGARVRPDEKVIDQDLFGATLDVIQNFMRTSFPALQGRWLRSIRTGDRILVLEPGDQVLLTVLIRGEETQDLHLRMREALRTFEARNRGRLGRAVVDPDAFVGTEDLMRLLLGPSPRGEGSPSPGRRGDGSQPKPERG